MRNYFKIEAISNSLMGQIKKELLNQPALNQNSPALRFGDAVHKLILEPQNFDFRLYSGRERMAFMKMQTGCMAVAGHCMNGDKEVEYEYEYMGFRCKMKADIVCAAESTITDLKTTRWSSHEDFLSSAIEYDYPRQAAWYLDAPPVKALGIKTFRIIALCKTDPYQTFIWEMDIDDPLIEAGREDYHTILEYVADMEKYNHLKINQHEPARAN